MVTIIPLLQDSTQPVVQKIRTRLEIGGQMTKGTLVCGDSCLGGNLSWKGTCSGGQLSRGTNVSGTLVRGTNVTPPLFALSNNYQHRYCVNSRSTGGIMSSCVTLS